MHSKKDIKFAVIGLGKRSRLLEHLNNPELGIKLAGVCDSNLDRLKSFKDNFGDDILMATDIYQLLSMSDIDVVFILSPDYLHEEHSAAALQAGKDVYVEKPLAITVEGCDRILETAMKSKKRIYAGHNMRHMEFVSKMKELIDDGAVGEVKAGWCRHFISYGGDAYFKDWHAERSKTGSLLLQKGAHDIDVLHFLCGGYSKMVNAFGNLSVYNRITDRHSPDKPGDPTWQLDNWPPLSQKGLNHVIDVEDLSMMQMVLDNGVLCSYQQCHYTPDAWRNYTIIGTEGRIENFGDYPGDCMIRLWNKKTHHKPEGDEQFVIGPTEGSHGGSDPAIVKEFIDFIRGEKLATTSPLAARNSVAAGIAATDSLRQGGIPVNVIPPSDQTIEYFHKMCIYK